MGGYSCGRGNGHASIAISRPQVSFLKFIHLPPYNLVVDVVFFDEMSFNAELEPILADGGVTTPSSDTM